MFNVTAIDAIKARLVDQGSIARFEILEDEAAAFVAKRPDLEPMSLDEWLAEHHDHLTADERATGIAILDLLYEQG